MTCPGGRSLCFDPPLRCLHSPASGGHLHPWFVRDALPATIVDASPAFLLADPPCASDAALQVKIQKGADLTPSPAPRVGTRLGVRSRRRGVRRLIPIARVHRNFPHRRIRDIGGARIFIAGSTPFRIRLLGHVARGLGRRSRSRCRQCSFVIFSIISIPCFFR